MSMKKIIKALIPNKILEKIQFIRALKRAEKFKGFTTQKIFSEVYKNNIWGKSTDPK